MPRDDILNDMFASFFKGVGSPVQPDPQFQVKLFAEPGQGFMDIPRNGHYTSERNAQVAAGIIRTFSEDEQRQAFGRTFREVKVGRVA